MLRSGGDFTPLHVQRLAKQIRTHVSRPYRLYCLTDLVGQDFGGAEPIKLLNNWPGWFSKIELFRPGLFRGPVFYADLDSLIVAPLCDLVVGHKFTVLENFWRADRIGSGLMAWDADLSQIYERFVPDAWRLVLKYSTRERWGDQVWIRDNTPFEPERWQTKHPGAVVSYKLQKCQDGVPKGARIVCYHGKPRPWATRLAQSVYAEESDEADQQHGHRSGT